MRSIKKKGVLIYSDMCNFVLNYLFTAYAGAYSLLHMNKKRFKKSLAKNLQA